MKRFFIVLLSVLCLIILGCDSKESTNKNKNKEKDHGHHHHEKGTNGGNVLDSGGKLHIEFVHSKKEGKVSLYILGGDGKTPLKITKAPILNIKTKNGSKQIKTKMVAKDGSHYQATDSALKSTLNGRIAADFEGKRYNLDIETSHDHGSHDDHGDHDDRGHNHDDHANHDDHGHDHPEHSINHTTWTQKCEWFVELETPEEGKPAGFTAHITLLNNFSPVEKGTFTVKAVLGSLTTSVTEDKPARSGIYTPKITFPKAGKWSLQLTYTSGDVSDTIQYTIEVYKPGKIPHNDESEDNSISFSKEQQWKIPFATVWSKDGKIPSSAIFEQGESTFVYIQLDGESFEKRKIKISEKKGDWVKISDGLKDKERVVTKGTTAIMDHS